MFIEVTIMGINSKQKKAIVVDHITSVQHDVLGNCALIQTTSDNQYYSVLETKEQVLTMIEQARCNDPIVKAIDRLCDIMDIMGKKTKCNCEPEKNSKKDNLDSYTTETLFSEWKRRSDRDRKKLNLPPLKIIMTESNDLSNFTDSIIWKTTPPPRDGSFILANFTPLKHLMDPNQTYFVCWGKGVKAWCSVDHIIYESINKFDSDNAIDPTRWIPFSDLVKIKNDMDFCFLPNNPDLF